MPVEPNPFDDERLKKINEEEDPDPLIQYYIVRKDIPMSLGKICAQVAHGAQMFAMAFAKMDGNNPIPWGGKPMLLTRCTKKWMDGSFRKVVLGGKAKDFEKIKEELDVFVVRDAGLTEIEMGTESVLVTWPILKSKQPKSLSKLQLLKTLTLPKDNKNG